jgi:hypothetical protein
MTRGEQRALLVAFCDSVRDQMLARSDNWPDSWDGLELRQLAARAFDFEANLPTWTRNRQKDFNNDWITRNLY